ncbi:MAG: TIGR01777 family oxidoreductase [Pseudomonadota bacterium]|nr:TIGR01777 family oxidoreductase [Pseudomonadota bacterium]
MRVLITGGSGFIGRALSSALAARGDEVIILTRSPQALPVAGNRRVVAALEQIEGPLDAVVNLAGAPIVDQRWSASRKQVLRASRIEVTNTLVAWMQQQAPPPAVLVSASATGYYGSHADEVLDESAEPTPGFAHELCRDWERAALEAESLGVRVCLIRLGVVLGAGGGALAKMLPLFRLGLGGPVGSGKQWLSWIHLDDVVAATLYLLDSPPLHGPFNLTAPEPVTNELFSRTLGRRLHRPAFLRVPATVMKLLLGEASELLLEGQRVVPENLLTAGYRFQQPRLEDALRSILEQKS